MSKLSQIREVLFAQTDCRIVDTKSQDRSPYANDWCVQEIAIVVYLAASLDSAEKLTKRMSDLATSLNVAVIPERLSNFDAPKGVLKTTITYQEPIFSKMVTIHQLDESDTAVPIYTPYNNKYVQLYRSITITIYPDGQVYERLRRRIHILRGNLVDKRVLNFLSEEID